MSLADQLWCPTSVQVTVLQARGLKIKGKGGTNDAFAVMQVGKEKYQTTVAEKSVAPVWKEEATFDLPQLQQQPGGGGGAERSTLHVHVHHRALVGPDKLLGQAVINLLQLSQDKTRSKTEWFKLLDKTGKADKDRGEVLVDIQFLRNNMTASMFDLSATGRSKSRLGKFKDKVRGKKKDSGASFTAAPSFTQVLTDSEDEEGNGDGEEAAGKEEKKKKKKIKSLFSPKTNLQKNMSQSMSVLPAKNSLSGSQSSGLNVDASEGKKKFKFMIHKRSGSSGAKDFSSAQQKAAEQSNLCINGSHVYYDEPQNRTSRIGSNFSLASSGHGSMEDVPDSSPPSVDSLRTTRQYSPWTEEEISESLKEGEEEEETQIEEEKVYVEEGVEKENARKKEEKILKEEEMRQEEEKRRLEEKQRWHEEKVRKEEEMIRMEEERKKEQRLEEEKRWEEEKTRENEERRKDMERKRLEEERRMLEERRRMEEEEEKRLEEERRLEKEEEKRLEEERRRLEERRMLEEEEGKRLEEERRRLEEERIRLEKEEEEEKRLEVERRMLEERGRLEKEEEEKRLEEERRRLEEEERRRQEERRRLEEEEEKRLEEERRRLEEEDEKRLEEEEEERRRLEKEERRRLEKEERRRLEEEKRLEEERRRVEEEEEERRLEQKARKEEEKRKEMERVEEEVRKEERRMEEEKRKQEEKRNIEERFKEEMERHEQEKRQQDLDKEKEEKARRDMEGYARTMKEIKKQEEEEREQMIIEQRKEKEDQRIWKEEEDRARKEREEEERLLAENKEEVEKKAENFPSEEQMKNVTQIKSDVIASLNPFDENYRPPAGTRTSPPAGSRTSPPAGSRTSPPAGSRTSPPAGSRTSPPAGSRTSPPAASLLRPRTSSSDDKDQGGSQREKRPAPQPPGKHQAPRGPQGSPPRADRRSTDIGTAPQKSFRATSPVGRSDPQNTSMHSSSVKVTLTGAKQGKGPAPSRPCPGARAPPTSNISHTSSLDVKQAPVSYGLNPFEDDEDEDEANFDPTRWPPAAASSSKFKSSKKARAPPLPELCDTPSTSVGLNPGGDPDPAVVVPDNHQVLPCDPGSISEAKPVTPQGSGGKREEPPTTKRRLLPVKPLNPLRQAVNQGGKDIQAFGILNDDLKNTKGDLELKGPYSQLTKAELISLVLKQDNQLLEKDKKVSELEQYIDNLLVRVMEEQPSILMSMNTLKKSV